MSRSLEGADSVLPQRRELPARAAGQELLLRDQENGTVHFISSTAALVWECCDGRSTVSQCAARLRTSFAVPEGTDLAADISEIVGDFHQRGLLHSETPSV